MSDGAVYPGGWERMPVEVRRYIAHLLLEKMRDVFDDKNGTADLIKFVMVGRPREGLLASRAYQMTGEEWYPLLVEDAAAWDAARRGPTV